MFSELVKKTVTDFLKALTGAKSNTQTNGFSVSLHVEGKLTAKHTCLISHWAHKAGAAGPVSSLGFRPDAPSGHYQRHLDTVAGLKAKPGKYLSIPVPGMPRYDQSRRVQQVKVYPPHECLHEEHVNDPELAGKVLESSWPPSYSSHRTVLANPGKPTVPLALYLDAAQYLRRDTVIVFVTCNLLSGSRHLSGVLRKKDLCRCGCKGWCTYWEVFSFLAWTLRACQDKVFPTRRHDNEPWDRFDTHRATMGGLDMFAR